MYFLLYWLCINLTSNVFVRAVLFFGTSGYTVSTVKTYKISRIGFTITYIGYMT